MIDLIFMAWTGNSGQCNGPQRPAQRIGAVEGIDGEARNRCRHKRKDRRCSKCCQRKPGSEEMASSKKQAAGVIGLGSMGLGVARTLLKKGFEVHAFDVRPEVSKAFAKEGGIAAKSPADVGRNAPVVIILVVNADQTNEVLFGKDGAVST